MKKQINLSPDETLTGTYLLTAIFLLSGRWQTNPDFCPWTSYHSLQASFCPLNVFSITFFAISQVAFFSLARAFLDYYTRCAGNMHT